MLASRVWAALGRNVTRLLGVGETQNQELARSDFYRADLAEHVKALALDSPDASLIVFGLPREKSMAQQIVNEVARRENHGAILWERVGREISQTGSDLNCDGIRVALILNELHRTRVAEALPNAQVLHVGMCLPEGFYAIPPSKAPEREIVYLGRPTRSKGFFDLLGWWERAALFDDGFRLTACLVGADTEALGFKLPRGVYCQAVSGVSERARIFNRAAACVYPATYDNLPQSLVEAMASAGLVVCTDIDAHRAVVVHRSNGLLVPPNLDGLSEAVRHAASDPVSLLSIRHMARKSMRRQIREVAGQSWLDAVGVTCSAYSRMS